MDLQQHAPEGDPMPLVRAEELGEDFEEIEVDCEKFAESSPLRKLPGGSEDLWPVKTQEPQRMRKRHETLPARAGFHLLKDRTPLQGSSGVVGGNPDRSTSPKLTHHLSQAIPD